MQMDLNLAGRVAVVTGAATGIGAEIVSQLAAEGCVVWVADYNLVAANQFAAELTERGYVARAVMVDVGDPLIVASAIDKVIEVDGRVDILVCNAGVLKVGDFADVQLKDWEEVSRINLSGVVYCAKAVLRPMAEQRSGCIINMASVSAMRGGGSIGNTLYGATKAGVVALTQGFARELGPLGIRVNAIAPAVVDTPMTHSSLSEDVRLGIEAKIPLRRLGRVTDIANLVTYLASDRASFITGTTIPVDGGILTT